MDILLFRSLAISDYGGKKYSRLTYSKYTPDK